MSNEANYTDFITFVKDQPSDQEINHFFWGTCAIGDYLDSIDESRTDSMDFVDNHLAPANTRLYNMLDLLETAKKFASTYGALAEWLEKDEISHTLNN